jgi:hypothetical protein
MSKQQGRKALIILTDGVTAAAENFGGSDCHRSAPTQLSLHFICDEEEGQPFRRIQDGRPDGRWPRRRQVSSAGRASDGKKILEQPSKETGGRLFKVRKGYRGQDLPEIQAPCAPIQPRLHPDKGNRSAITRFIRRRQAERPAVAQTVLLVNRIWTEASIHQRDAISGNRLTRLGRNTSISQLTSALSR